VTVPVGTSGLGTVEASVGVDVVCRGGPVRVDVAWTAPAGRAATGLVLLQHGFTRQPRHLRGLALALASAGLVTARPAVASLGPRRTLLDPTFLTALTLALADLVERPPDDPENPLLRSGIHVGSGGLVLMGHSAGAAVACHQAAVLAERGGGTAPVATVLLDGTESPTGLVARALPVLADLAVRLVAAPPARCNRRGALTAQLAAGRAGLLGVTVLGGGHGDAEDARGRPPAVYRAACGDRTAPEDRALVRGLAVAWAAGFAAGESTPRPDAGGLDRFVRDGRLALLHGAGPATEAPSRP
jgi:hypothetical protein